MTFKYAISHKEDHRETQFIADISISQSENCEALSRGAGGAK
jgi:hypothetical protein